MKSILAEYSASITELKKNPSALLDQAQGRPIAILNHNTPTAYLLPASTYATLLNSIDKDTMTQISQQFKTKT